jgi:hypothetical protein
MKASTKHRHRYVRALAIAGAVTALAAPAGASAMPIGPHSAPPITQVSDQGSDAGAGMQQFGPGELTGGGQPSNYKSEIPALVRASHAGTHVQTPSGTIHQVKTVVNDDSHTLAIALAASALGIALCGVGYATIRLAQIQRRLGVSH